MSSPFYLLKKIPLTNDIMVNQYKKRARQIVRRISPFIGKKEKILDIGTGTGFVAAGIAKVKNKNITCVDVHRNPLNISDKIIIYNGKKLPFSDNSFDTVLLFCITAKIHQKF